MIGRSWKELRELKGAQSGQMKLERSKRGQRVVGRSWKDLERARKLKVVGRILRELKGAQLWLEEVGRILRELKGAQSGWKELERS